MSGLRRGAIALRGWRLVLLVVAAAWGAALAYVMAAGRVMYGDGAFFLYVHLNTPHRFDDYDFQRSFASIVTQAPVLLGQRLGMQDVSAYAALYAFGTLVVPAAAYVAALWISRRQPFVLGAIVAAIAVYGFGVNFINTEANLFFGLVWLAVAILAVDVPRPVLRSLVLPAIGIVLLRTYEGMLLVGPVLALWAWLASGRVADERERLGLALSALLFCLGAAIGFGGFLSPRDPGNAGNFVANTFHYLRNPQVFVLLAALLAWGAALATTRRGVVVAGVLATLCGAGFLVGIARLHGYFAYAIYYENRAFLAFALPVFLLLLVAASRLRPRWLQAAEMRPASAVLLLPVLLAVAADAVGTYRWSRYTQAFCAVLQQRGTPSQRLERLKDSGVMTGWAWTHPTMSLLLRGKDGGGMVANEPGQYEPFDYRTAASVPYRGFCGPTAGAAGTTISFRGALPGAPVRAVRGLASPEAWATWSEGPVVEIEFANPLPRSFVLEVRVAAVFGRNRGAPITVRAGNVERTFAVDREPFETTLEFRDVGQASTLSFAIPHPESPAETGAAGGDPRKLGIAFQSLTVRPQ